MGGGKDNTHEDIVAKFRLQTQGTEGWRQAAELAGCGEG